MLDPQLLAARNALNDNPGEGVLWTRVNVGEAIPGTVTPLTADFQRPANTWPAARMFHRMGLIPRPHLPGWDTPETATSRFFCGKLAISVDFLRWIADRTPGTSGDSFEASILGSVREGVRSSPDRSRYAIAMAKIPFVVKELPGDTDRLYAETFGWWQATTDKIATADIQSAAAAFTQARQRNEDICTHAGLVAAFSPAVLDQLSRPVRRIGAEEDLLSIAAGYGNIHEGEMLDQLWAVAKGCMRPDLFLATYGYMCPAGGELESRSWREDRGALDSLLGSFRHAPRSERPRAKLDRSVDTAQRKRAELLGKAGFAARLELRFGLWLANRILPLREAGKACMFMACDVARAAARRAGHLLTQRGDLSEPDDVFYLTYAELMAAAAGAPISPETVAERRALRAVYADIDLPDFFTSDQLKSLIWEGAKQTPRPHTAISTADAPPTEEFTLKGAPASAGRVTGRARVVLDPRRAGSFVKGDILVCHVTDPGWTTLLTVAGAMVVDIGGMLSHTAIIARELGVPAVVNTRDGTRRIPDGATITVDGAQGRVTVHSSAVDRLKTA